MARPLACYCLCRAVACILTTVHCTAPAVIAGSNFFDSNESDKAPARLAPQIPDVTTMLSPDASTSIDFRARGDTGLRRAAVDYLTNEPFIKGYLVSKQAMNKQGPIVVIEDDQDDQMMLKEVFKILKTENEVLFFCDGVKALAFLKEPNVYPFLILSDINMPKLDGFDLKRMVHTNDELSIKCIPYLFFTTAVNEKAVYDAYTMSAQGFFVKPNSFDELVDTLGVMIEYWKRCYSPSNFSGKPQVAGSSNQKA